jgi:hypothetical protein
MRTSAPHLARQNVYFPEGEDAMENRLVDSFKRIGFRKWYERQLLSSHAHMVLAFLSVIALIGSMEAFRTAEGAARLVDVLFVVVCTAIGGWALRRYLFLLMRAEQAANQASCPDCGDTAASW